MAAEVDREAFMRLMGLTAADVADPDSVPPRAATRPQPSARSAAAVHKFSSPTTPSLSGLSHSASLRGDGDQIVSSHSNLTKTSLNPHQSPVTQTRSSARSVTFDTPPPPSAASARASSLAENLKEKGNRAFESGDFAEAVQHYSAAIESMSQPGSPTPSADTELLAALHSNRSAAYLQSARHYASAEEAYARALCDADRAVALRPSWFKGYTRQGDAYFKLRRYGTAAEAYEMALQLDPNNATLSNALAETRQRAKQSAREDVELRRTMRSTGHSQASSASNTLRGSADGEAPDMRQTMSGTHRTAASATLFHDDTTAVSSGRRRSSGQAQQLWADLKHEVEVTTQEPTGDAYRLQQLERFRKRAGATAAAESRPAEPRRTFHHSNRTAPTNSTTEETPANAARNTRRAESDFSSVAAPSALQKESAEQRNSALPSAERFDEPSPVVQRPSPSAAATARAPPTSSPPMPPPRRSSYEAPTAGGIPAAMANFSGPVTSARDVPYEFSSAAASAYQQKLLESFRQRKARQPQ